MAIPGTYLSLHQITSISALHLNTLGAPVVIKFRGDHGDMNITVFSKEGDPDYSARLVKAINDAAIAPPTEPDSALEAACKAANHYYGYDGADR